MSQNSSSDFSGKFVGKGRIRLGTRTDVAKLKRIKKRRAKKGYR